MGDYKSDDHEKHYLSSQECVEESVWIGINDDKYQAPASEKKGFVRTSSSDTQSIITNKIPGILI